MAEVFSSNLSDDVHFKAAVHRKLNQFKVSWVDWWSSLPIMFVFQNVKLLGINRMPVFSYVPNSILLINRKPCIYLKNWHVQQKSKQVSQLQVAKYSLNAVCHPGRIVTNNSEVNDHREEQNDRSF